MNLVAGALDLVIPNATLDDANAFNDLVDGSAEASNADQSNTLGTVRWGTPSGALQVRLAYRINFAAGC